MMPIGKMIEAEFRSQGHSVAWFARQLACHRTNVYDIFERQNIDVGLLMRISTLLHHNFMRDLAEQFDKGNAEGGPA